MKTRDEVLEAAQRLTIEEQREFIRLLHEHLVQNGCDLSDEEPTSGGRAQESNATTHDAMKKSHNG